MPGIGNLFLFLYPAFFYLQYRVGGASAEVGGDLPPICRYSYFHVKLLVTQILGFVARLTFSPARQSFA